MTSPDWIRVRQIFEAALDREPAARRQFVHDACGSDCGLLAEVESLLEADALEQDSEPTAPLSADSASRRSAQLLDAGVTDELVGSPPTRAPGTRVGQFLLGEELGSGGMGTVFSAQQDRPRRTVAIKMMRSVLADARAKRRFEFEAELLGRLRHPGIAQVLESGTVEAHGIEQPYFAMEWIEGALPLDQYVQQRGLATEAWLQLFINVCDAVHYGHQRGVIHRDLKPANILVDRSGHAKVIDFGIARATYQDGPGHSLMTDAGQVLGTLAYMSPELLDAPSTAEQSGVPVDTRVDVYGLGIVLYELITGHPPFTLGELSLTAAALRVREQSPPRPSLAEVTGDRRRVDPSIDSVDLDWIVLKAIEKEPDRRYASASELAADLRRLLACEPVLAGPPSTSYRVKKFVRRNRAAVTAAALGVLVLIIGTIATGVGWSRARSAETLAEQRRKQAESVTDQLWRASRLAESVRDRAGKQLDAQLKDRIDAAVHRLDRTAIDNPSVEAGIRNYLGTSYEQLGWTAPALEQLERALTRLRSHENRISGVYTHVLTNLGRILSNQGEIERAESLLRECVALQAQRFGEDRHQTAKASVNLAGVLLNRGRYDDADRLYSRAHDFFNRQYGPGDRATIGALRGRAIALDELDRHDEAIELLRSGIIAATRSLGSASTETLELRNSLAVTLQNQRRFAEAGDVLSALLGIRTEVLGADHPTTLGVHNNLALNLMKQKRYPQAEAAFREILRLRRNREGEHDKLGTLIPRNNLVMVLYEQSDPTKLAECETEARSLLTDAEALLPPGNWRTAIFRRHLGVCLTKLRRFDEAEPCLKRAVETLVQSLGADHRRTRSTLEELHKLYSAWGKPEAADAVRKRLGPG